MPSFTILYKFTMLGVKSSVLHSTGQIALQPLLLLYVCLFGLVSYSVAPGFFQTCGSFHKFALASQVLELSEWATFLLHRPFQSALQDMGILSTGDNRWTQESCLTLDV